MTTSESAPAPTTSGPLLVSFADIAWDYDVDPAGYGFLRIFEDETLVWAGDRNDPYQVEMEARIEGSTVVVTEPDCGQGVERIYEFHLSNTDGFGLILVEDVCPGRAGLISGAHVPVGRLEEHGRLAWPT